MSDRRGTRARAGDRDGFALLAVLWLIAMLAVLVSVRLGPVLDSLEAAENRIHRTRGLWAAQACLDLVRSRYVDGGGFQPLDSIALGSATWCQARPFNVDERINPNATDSIGLTRALGDAGLVASILDWVDADDLAREGGAEMSWYAERSRRPPRQGPLASPLEVALVRGFEEVDGEVLEAIFTTAGNGAVSPNRAPLEVLRSASLLPIGGAETLIDLRESGRTFRSAEQVALSLGMQPTVEEFQRLQEQLSFADNRRRYRIRGLVNDGERTVVSELIVRMIGLPDRVVLTRVSVR